MGTVDNAAQGHPRTKSSTYLSTAGEPLPLRISLTHFGITLDEFDITNIRKNDTIIYRPGPSVAITEHMRPLFMTITRMSNDANYERFKGLLVTFRFRRVRSRGRGRATEISGGEVRQR